MVVIIAGGGAMRGGRELEDANPAALVKEGYESGRTRVGVEYDA